MYYLYDFDGTLVRPMDIDYERLKGELMSKLGTTTMTPMIDTIHKHTSDTSECFDIIDRYELSALDSVILNTPCINLYIASFPRIIVSRNGLKVINEFFRRTGLPVPDFISCRDTCRTLKPHPAQLEQVFSRFDILTPSNTTLVGDSWHDREASKLYGCRFLDIHSMERIFVTGGAGFIGSALVSALMEKGHDVTVYDSLIFGDTLPDGVRFIKGDILDVDLLTDSMKGHTIVIHLAAQLEVTKSYKDSMYDLNVNLIGSLRVIDACRKNGIKRLINASSACVYGFTDGVLSKETDSTDPNWEYGISKLAAEKYIQISGLDYTSLRFSIVYGPNEWYGRVLTLFVKRAIEGKDLIIFGDGMQERDYVHVYDAVDFILQCIINPNTLNKVYNVSTGKGTRIIDLAKMVKSRFGSVNIVFDCVNEGEVSSLVPGRERLNNELRYLLLDNTRACTDTPWKPKRTLESELDSYIEWVQQNTNRWSYLKV